MIRRRDERRRQTEGERLEEELYEPSVRAWRERQEAEKRTARFVSTTGAKPTGSGELWASSSPTTRQQRRGIYRTNRKEDCMTKPAGHPRGRPRKHPRPEDAPASTMATVEGNEEAVIEERISELEAELTALEGPPAPLTATDIAQGAVALVDKHEQRHTAIEKLLSAFKIKRLEMRRSRYERELEPLG